MKKAATTESLRLEYLPLSQLRGAARNPKKHAQGDIQTSINRFGYVEPIVLDERTGRLVAGHGRRESLASLKAKGQEPPSGIKDEGGEWLVPVLRGWASRSDQEADAYLLASNQLTVAGGWDNGPLAEMLKELSEAGALDGVGFDAAALTDLLDEAGPQAGNSDPDEVPEKRQTDIQLGDLFQLGEHRLLCGDSTKAEDVDRVMAGDLASLVFTDPPYGVSYEDSLGRKVANDDKTGDELQSFLALVFAEAARASIDNCAWYVWHSSKFQRQFENALDACGVAVRQQIIWVKGEGVEGSAQIKAPAIGRSDFRWLHEPCFYGSRGHPYNAGDRTTTTVWTVTRPTTGTQHPTQKPTGLVEIGITNSSKRGDICFEPFSGSGSTLLACEQTGRKCRAIELEPQYVQVAIDRWEKFTGKKAVKLEAADAS